MQLNLKRWLLPGLWLVCFIPFLYIGSEYYVLSPADRAYSDLHPVFKPTGTFGHPLGIWGSLLMFMGVASYMLRKRVPFLQQRGKLRNWLTFHIFLCTLGPALVLLHTSFKFGGIVSIAFWSMTIVVLSGVLGRYVYVRIPKNVAGNFKQLAAVKQDQNALLASITSDGGTESEGLRDLLELPEVPRKIGMVAAIGSGISYDFERRKRLRRLGKLLPTLSIPESDQDSMLHQVDAYLRLSSQRFLLEPFSRIFTYWHTIHLPLAILMFVILVVHVGVAIAFGYY